MASTFKELFELVEIEVESAKHPPHSDFNKHYYRKMAEQIALNGKSSAIIIAIFFAVALGAAIMFEELRISERNGIIKKQRRELSLLKTDSVFYKCPHCLEEHSLRLIPDSTINAPTY